jgi:protein-L-isoaspartate(D-aspartate) O-methyltransferase
MLNSFSTNSQLVSHMVETGTLKSRQIIDAFMSVDRRIFVPDEFLSDAYGDYPLPIGEGQTISQPSTVAFMLELLGAKPGEHVLDIGSGSGYSSAVLSRIVGEEGFVTGLERVPGLVIYARQRLALLGVKNVEIKEVEGDTLGICGMEFDRILVSAAAEELPKTLISQLKKGGVLVIPVGNHILRCKKEADGKVAIDSFYGFSFVPLIFKE